MELTLRRKNLTGGNANILISNFISAFDFGAANPCLIFPALSPLDLLLAVAECRLAKICFQVWRLAQVR